MDGAMYHNCPVPVAHHERRMIWADTANTVPDILLSIGTGVGALENAAQAQDPDFSKFNRPLACNTIWTEFLADIGPQAYDSSSDNTDMRYMRVNPEFSFDVPRPDAVDKLPDLIAETKEYTSRHTRTVGEIAHKLIASSFFFEKDSGTVRACEGRFQCSGQSDRLSIAWLDCIHVSSCCFFKGRIRCRLSSSPKKIKALGNLLRDCFVDTFDPHFVLEEIGTPSDEFLRIPVSETVINRMCYRGVFTMGDVNVIVSKETSITNISLCLQPREYSKSRSAFLPISGFPRGLMSEEDQVRGRHSQPFAFSPIEMPKLFIHVSRGNYRGWRLTLSLAVPAPSPKAPCRQDGDQPIPPRPRVSGESSRFSDSGSAPPSPNYMGRWGSFELRIPERFVADLDA